MADSPRYLIHLPNGSTIGVCGPDVELVGWAINTWAGAVGRKYDVVADCKNELIDNWIASTDYAKKRCALSNNKTAFSSPSTSPQLLVDCGHMDGAPGYLHEVGHLFGLCDQYSAALGNCVSNNGIVAGSVMNAATETTLTQDDIDGITALAGKTRFGSP